jgi:NAD-dependent SIR2 family protein deacetylase
MSIPSELVPYCPKCGKPMSMNLRADNTFIEDQGWEKAAERYTEFLRRHKNMKVLFLELGVGFNTPSIIKFNFWRMTNEWKDATYACLNYGEAGAPDEIKKKSICINDDIGDILEKL